MRLTLRTLLAYLDDRLSPTNAKEIGLKIANSPFATDLLNRIKEVKRRRRLAVPDKAQPMIEPNLIAEYLDDQLTPELVARVEREILASDAMLAEVAAAHEILGLLRDPVSIEPRLRDRLYGLDPTGNVDVVRAIRGDTSEAGSEPPAPWKPLPTQTTASKRMPVILAAVLGIIWLVVIVSDSGLVGPRSGDKGEAKINLPKNAEENAEENADEKVGDEVANAEPGQQAADVQVAANDPDTNKPTVTEPMNETRAPPEDVPVAATVPSEPGTKDGAKPVVDSGVASAATTDAPVTVVPDTVIGAPDKLLPGLEKPAAYFLQGDSRGILVLRAQPGRWTTLLHIPGGETVERAPNNVNCGPLIGTDWFGVLERFPLQVATRSKGYTATLLGPCLIRFQAGSTGGLDMLMGRVKVGVDKNAGWDDDNHPRFVLGLGSKRSLITLQSQNTRIAVEVIPVASAPPAADAPAAVRRVTALPFDSDLRVMVTVLEGSIAISGSDDEAVELANGQRASWMILDMNDFSSFATDNGEPLASAPAWLFASDQAIIPETEKLHERLLEALSKTGEPGDCVLPLLDDRNTQVGVLAVQVLSLIHDSDRLLSVLFEARDESVHRAAIDGLSSIARGSMTARQKIRSGLETRLSKLETESIVQLIVGLTEVQARDPSVTAELIQMLESDRVAIRTLAIYRMEEITKDRKGFHPDGDAVRRRDAIRRWQRFLDQNSGSLIP